MPREASPKIQFVKTYLVIARPRLMVAWLKFHNDFGFFRSFYYSETIKAVDGVVHGKVKMLQTPLHIPQTTIALWVLLAMIFKRNYQSNFVLVDKTCRFKDLNTFRCEKVMQRRNWVTTETRNAWNSPEICRTFLFVSFTNFPNFHCLKTTCENPKAIKRC